MEAKTRRLEIEQKPLPEGARKLLLLSAGVSLAAAAYSALAGMGLAAAVGSAGALFASLAAKRKERRKEYLGVDPYDAEARYFVDLGRVVKEHAGDVKETAKESNLLDPVLLDDAMHSTHYAIVGTTGSGKTVTMQNVMEEALDAGGGFIFVDGKGSVQMIRQIYTLAALRGRAEDFQIINFADPKASMTLDFWSLAPKEIVAILAMLLEEKVSKSPEWGQWGTGMGERTARLLLALRDKYGKIPDPRRPDPDTKLWIELDFRSFFAFFDHRAAFDLIRTLRKMEIDEKIREQLEAYLEFFSTASKCAPSDVLQKDYEDLAENVKQFTYAWNVGKSYWMEIISKITVDMRELFEGKGEVNVKETIMQGKILYYVIPGTGAKTDVTLASNVLLASIRAAYERLKELDEGLNPPFTVILDEMNVWADTVKGIGALMAQTREQRLAFVCGYQTDLKLDPEGKEGSMIWGNANTKIVLRVDDPELIERINRNFAEEETIEEEPETREDGKRRWGKRERPLLDKNLLQRLAPGESFIIRRGKVEKFLSRYRPPLKTKMSPPALRDRGTR